MFRWLEIVRDITSCPLPLDPGLRLMWNNRVWSERERVPRAHLPGTVPKRRVVDGEVLHVLEGGQRIYVTSPTLRDLPRPTHSQSPASAMTLVAASVPKGRRSHLPIRVGEDRLGVSLGTRVGKEAGTR